MRWTKWTVGGLPEMAGSFLFEWSFLLCEKENGNKGISIVSLFHKVLSY